jgi:hypothetical protein
MDSPFISQLLEIVDSPGNNPLRAEHLVPLDHVAGFRLGPFRPLRPTWFGQTSSLGAANRGIYETSLRSPTWRSV